MLVDSKSGTRLSSRADRKKKTFDKSGKSIFSVRGVSIFFARSCIFQINLPKI